jgi:light-regulated signal transduction histidine kinase (bacteriophytochrome)
MMQGKGNENHDFETKIFYKKVDELKNLKGRLRRAEEVLQHVEEFNRDFVHKLKNYLTPIKTCSELSLQEIKEEDPLKEKVEKILEYTDEVTKLANGWLLKLHCWLELEANDFMNGGVREIGRDF